MVFFSPRICNSSVISRTAVGAVHITGKSKMFEIKFTDNALEDLEIFPRSEQKEILASLESQLTLDAAKENEDRRRLHSNGMAEWEIRLGNDVRVFYDVDIQTGTVKIEAVGKTFLR